MIGFSLLKSNPELPREAVEDNYSIDVLNKKFVVRCEERRKYYVFDSYDDFLDRGDTAKYQMYHEVNLGGRQRLKFDLDADVEKLETIFRGLVRAPVPDAEVEEYVTRAFAKTTVVEFTTPEHPDHVRIARVVDAFRRAISAVIVAVRDTFFSSYSEELPLDAIVICDSSGFKGGSCGSPALVCADLTSLKLSAHIIVDRAVSSNKQAHEFLVRARPYMSAMFWPVIDAGVYKSVQNFRIVDQKKPDGRVKRIITETCAGDPAPHPREMTTIAPTQATPLMPDLITERKNVVGIDLSQEDVGAVLELLEKEGLLADHKFSRNVRGLFRFTRTCSSQCDICTEAVAQGLLKTTSAGPVYHDKDATMLVFVYYDVGDKITVYRKCRHESDESRTCGRKCINKRVGQVAASRPGLAAVAAPDPAVTTCGPRWSERMIAKALTQQGPAATKFERATTQITRNMYSAPELTSFEAARTLVVHAPMKIGKTKKLKEFIATNYPAGKLSPPKIVFLSFRQTFSRNIKENFADFTLYSDVRGPLVQDRVIVQVESLHRLSIAPGQPLPDLLVLDECESIIEQFGSGLLRENFAECFAKFQYLLKYSRSVICMDAMVTDRTYNVIETIRGIKDLVYHKNEYQNAADYDYRFFADKGVWLAALMSAIGAGDRIAVPSSSLTEAKALVELIRRDLPHLHVGLYSSETTYATRREHFGDVNTHWSVYDVLVYTPTISAGVSFESKHFSKVFCLFTDQSCCAETCVQMIGRIRDVADKQVNVFLGLTGASFPTTREAIISQLCDCRSRLKDPDMSAAVTIGYSEDGQKVVHKTPYFTVWVENLLSKNASKNAFAQRLIPYIKSTGAKCTVVTDAVLETAPTISPAAAIGCPAEEVEARGKTAGANVMVAKKVVADRENAAVAAADDISDDIAAELTTLRQQQIDITEDQRRSLERHRLRRTYGYRGDITQTFVATYKSASTIRAFKNLSRFTALMADAGQNSPADPTAQIAAALDILRGFEAATHTYLMTNDRHNDDLNRKYVYRQHMLAHTLTSAVGWQSIYDRSYLSVCVAGIVIGDRQDVPRLVSQAVQEFGIKGPKKGDGTAGLLKFVGKLLWIMYMIKVVAAPDGSAFRLVWPREFSDSWDAESSGLVCYLPADSRPVPAPEPAPAPDPADGETHDDLAWLLEGI